MSEAKVCPLAVHPVTGRLDCVKDRCAIWSEYFAMCSFAVKEHQVPARTQAEYSYTRISDLQEEK